MSFALYKELKSLREQILDLLKRVESLEDFRNESRKKREVITLKKPQGAVHEQVRP
jgi:hypothetical protein